MTELTPEREAEIRAHHATYDGTGFSWDLLSELDRLRKRLEDAVAEGNANVLAIAKQRDAMDEERREAAQERDSARADLSRVMPVVEAARNLFEDEEGAVKLRAALDALPQTAVAGPVAYLLCACGQRSVSVSGEPLCEACIKAWAERLGADVVAAGEAERLAVAGPVGERKESR